jgi:hypothetical protein
MKTYGWRVEEYFHAFLTLALVEGEWPVSRIVYFILFNYWIGGYVDLRAGMNTIKGNICAAVGKRNRIPLSCHSKVRIVTALSRILRDCIHC